MGIFDRFRRQVQSTNPWDIMRAECVMLIDKYDMDGDREGILSQIDQMVDHAKATNESLDSFGKSISETAYTCVFNAAAFILMSHKYNLSSSALSLHGEMLLNSVRRMAQAIVDQRFSSKADIDDILNTIVSQIFFR